MTGIETSLTHGLKRFARLSKKTFHDPTPDHVHDLRVLTRRLRADLWLIPKTGQTPWIRKARHDLERLGHVLGEQRKYDVALEDATQYGRETKEIRKERKRARKEVLAALRAKKRHAYTDDLERAFAETCQMTPRSFSPRLEELSQQLTMSMEDPPKTDLARHQLRIRVKKARYLLEALNHDIPKLKELQDHLGRWHDLTVLSAISGNPKDLTEAHQREWGLAEEILRPALAQTTRALSELTVQLQANASLGAHDDSGPNRVH